MLKLLKAQRHIAKPFVNKKYLTTNKIPSLSTNISESNYILFNRKPLQGLLSEKTRVLDGGALEIADVTADDSATYTCRAYNGIGDGATREYTLRINSEYRLQFCF